MTLSARLSFDRGRVSVRLPRRGVRRIRVTRAQTATVVLRLSAPDRRRAVRGAPRVRVTLTARDPAGNAVTSTSALAGLRR